jgi:hypothetical protein
MMKTAEQKNEYVVFELISIVRLPTSLFYIERGLYSRMEKGERGLHVSPRADLKVINS